LRSLVLRISVVRLDRTTVVDTKDQPRPSIGEPDAIGRAEIVLRAELSDKATRNEGAAFVVCQRQRAELRHGKPSDRTPPETSRPAFGGPYLCSLLALYERRCLDVHRLGVSPHRLRRCQQESVAVIECGVR
jgi:hypothetical protein